MDEQTLPGGSHRLAAREAGPAGSRSCSQEQDFPAPRAGQCPQGPAQAALHVSAKPGASWLQELGPGSSEARGCQHTAPVLGKFWRRCTHVFVDNNFG